MRLKYNKNAIAKIQNSKYYLSNYPIKLNNSTILEIGMGKGDMIINMAKELPNFNFIGIEKYASAAVKVLSKLKNDDLKNFHFVVGDASKLDEYFVGNCQTIWLTFSDPWPKNKHIKRRLTYKSFLEKYEKLLEKNGILKIKTDNDNFYKFSINSLLENNWEIIYQTTNLHKTNKFNEKFQTGYEIKFSSLDKNINYLEAKKINKSS